SPLEPIDDNGHGTHTTGTMVGFDGGDNRIGVAPSARWIGTKCMSAEGGGTDEWFHDCFQWILAPTDLAGQNPDPARAPHAVNNSWGYSPGNDPVFEADVAALVAAGIFIEVSAGNEGPGCSTLRSPGDYENAFTTGSSRQGGLISDFSSRGPSLLYPEISKPEITAPGQDIRSSVPGGGYEGGWSGTSMAGPHTVGLVALIWSANPSVIGDIAATRTLIQNTAVFSDVDECSGDSRGVPNNVYGWGEIDCLAAVQTILPPISAGALLIDRTAYACSDALTISVKDSDLAGTGNLSVLVSSDSEIDPESVDLAEGIDGVFAGSIAIAEGTSAPDGTLQVNENDTITVLYLDENHGGTGPVDVRQTARVDCTAPTISGVTIDRVTSMTATLAWTTDEPATTAILYGLVPPLTHRIAMERLNTDHAVTIANLDECTDYLFAIETEDEAFNRILDDNGGAYYTFKTFRRFIALNETLDTDPGWTTEGDWAFGVPKGNADDPSAGHTGSHVYGYNLDGAYTNNMPKYALISPIFDFTHAIRTSIGYSLWLGVDAYPNDQAAWDVSLDGGASWYTLFDNSMFGGALVMDFWMPLDIDLSSLLDGQAQVQFRWTMGPTDASGVLSGWNIDDIWIAYDIDCDIPTPTPPPTATPEPTATPDHPLGVRIEMPKMVRPGEPFYISGYLDNPDEDLFDIPVFFILDVYGDMWFWPAWTHFRYPDHTDISYDTLDVPHGMTPVTVLPVFTWPNTGTSQASGLYMYGAMLESDMSQIIGTIAAVPWGYEP
ncbi:S8 family serine peptidase, partial [bacterium]|nr:S8 family serine peptidase [candidate division CSSED10-310 bacterium]